MKDETTVGNSQYILKAIYELLDDRLPKRHVGEQGPELMPVQADDLPGETVEPGDLRAGDKVALWVSGVSDVRLIERGPREDDPDEALAALIEPLLPFMPDQASSLLSLEIARAAREHIEAEKSQMGAALYYGASARVRAEEAERRVDELEPALARSETERDGWKAKHAAFRDDVERERGNLAQAGSTNAILRLDRALDRDAARDPQANPDTVTLRRDDVEALLRFWEIAGGNGVVRDIPRRVRAALGWGDSDDA